MPETQAWRHLLRWSRRRSHNKSRDPGKTLQYWKMSRCKPAKLTASLVVAIGLGSLPAGAQKHIESTDPYQWLEDVSGDRSMTWVKAENARTAKVLESDPRYADLA